MPNAQPAAAKAAIPETQPLGVALEAGRERVVAQLGG